jgi:hypothetical protein
VVPAPVAPAVVPAPVAPAMVPAPVAPAMVRKAVDPEAVLPALPNSQATNPQPASAPSAAPSTPERSSTAPPIAGPGAPAEPKIIDTSQKDRERRAPPAPYASPKRPDGTRPAPPAKPRAKEDFINPWPSPR